MNAERYRFLVTSVIWLCLLGGIVVLFQSQYIQWGAALLLNWTAPKWLNFHVTIPTISELNYTQEVIKIGTGSIQLLGALFGFFGGAKLGEEFSDTKPLNSDWHWVSHGTHVDGIKFLSQGIIEIRDIDDYIKRRKYPELVLKGHVEKLENRQLVAPYRIFVATDIIIGRKSTGRIIYLWKYMDDAAERTGVTIITVTYNETRSWKSFWIRKRIYAERMSGNFYSDQDAGKGQIDIFRDEVEANGRAAQIARDAQAARAA